MHERHNRQTDIRTDRRHTLAQPAHAIACRE